MKHTTYTKLFFSAAFVAYSLAAFAQNNSFLQPVERATARALAKSAVHVQVTLAKPVYMSEVMFRPVRGGKDTVIRVDYKQAACRGRLSAQKTYVQVPASCIAYEKYEVSQVNLTFADGRRVTKTGKSVEQKNQTAWIKL